MDYSAADFGTDILPTMGIASLGSSGFVPPLGAGAYTFWIQDFNVGLANYGFDLRLAAHTQGTVPEPAAFSLMLFGSTGCLANAVRLTTNRGTSPSRCWDPSRTKKFDGCPSLDLFVTTDLTARVINTTDSIAVGKHWRNRHCQRRTLCSKKPSSNSGEASQRSKLCSAACVA